MMQFFLAFLSEIYFNQKHTYTIIYVKTLSSNPPRTIAWLCKTKLTENVDKYSYKSDSALTEFHFLSVPSSHSQSELC